MTIEQRIQDAITDVRQSPEELVEIAAEYGIKPEVLRARIEKSYGSVEALAGRLASEARQVAERTEAAAKALEAAIARLEARYVITRDHRMKGTKFFYEGEEYVFVLLSRSHPKYFAQCVRVRDASITGFNRAAYNTLIVPAHNVQKVAA